MSIKTISEVVAATWRAVATLNSKDYTEYPLGTPHRQTDVEAWPAIAMKASMVDSPPSKESADEAVKVEDMTKEDLQSYKSASRNAYLFIDRGVSRAQGLLTFNSLVLAALIFTPTLAGSISHSVPKGLYAILLASLLMLVSSTLLSGCCLWIVWFRPAVHLDPRIEAPLVWKVWVDRSLLFNTSLVLAALAFTGVALALLFVFVRCLLT